MRALLVLPVVLLTGCGVAGTEFNPGVAAQVGDDTITTRQVDQLTHDYCKAYERFSKDQPQGNGPTPLRFFLGNLATTLIAQSAAEQLADQYDVQPTEDYKKNLAQVEGQFESYPASERKAVIEVSGAAEYTDNVLTQIGEQLLEDEGNSEASADDQLAAGNEELVGWVADHDVQVNPRYTVTLGGDPEADNQLSYAADDAAKGGLLDEPDADYAASLPDHAVCGS